MALSTIKKPGYRDFTIRKGDSFRRVLTLKQNGSAINLTGYSAEGMIRRRGDDREVVPFTASVLAPATNGQVEIKLTVTQTRTLPGKCVYDVQLILDATPEDNTHTILEGKISVPQEVTV